MSQTKSEMRGLYRRIVLDAIRRNPPAFTFLLIWQLILGLLIRDLPDYDPLRSFFALLVCVILPWFIALFHPDNRFLACLPLSQSQRGRAVWLSYTLDPLLALIPLLIIAVRFEDKSLYNSTIVLTAAVSSPLASVLYAHSLRWLRPVTILTGRLLPFLALLIALQYVNVLYWRMGFPWFFLLLTPFSILTLLWSYRRADLLGRVVLPESHPYPVETHGTSPPRRSLATSIGLLMLEEGGFLTLLFVLLLLLSIIGSGWLIFACLIPGLVLFAKADFAVWKRLQLLRVLPISRTGLAAAITACGVGAAILQICLGVFLCLTITRLAPLPGFPVNFALVLLCSSAFFPALHVLLGDIAKLADALFVSASYTAIGFYGVSAAKQFESLTPLPYVVMATAVCVTGAFFLLRYALLRPRLDWRYMREAQEMTARGSTT